jgi:GntR family transcriptional repressor for pyruvate dehydrogenase complex
VSSDAPTSSGFVARPITTRSAAEQIAEQIRVAILRGDLEPGARLPSESELAADYGVSRGTIRETMKLLSAAQLVEATRGAAGGTFVRLPEADRVAALIGETISLWFNAGSTSLAEVTAAREWIERGTVRLAAANAGAADLEEIREAVEAMEVPGIDMDEMLAVDIDFHAAVSRAAGNAVLDLAMTAIHSVRPWTNTMLVPHLTAESVAEQHRAIFAAIEAHDAERAEQEFRRHLDYLAAVRERALADRREEDVRIDALAHEAHPALEALRARQAARAARRAAT